MKLKDLEIITKGGCYMIVGISAALVSGLSQWAADGNWPPKVCWVLIFASAVGGGAGQLLAFLSGSYADYRKNGNGGTPEPPKTEFKPPGT